LGYMSFALRRRSPASLNLIVRRHVVPMCRLAVLLLVLLSVASGCSFNPSRPPSPNRSEYILSKAAGFLFVPGGGVVYGTAFALTRLIEKPVYAVALFENPESGAPPLRVAVTIEPGNSEFQVKSPRLNVLTNNRLYTVNLSIYLDDAHTQLLGVHQQQVLFSVPPDLELRIEREYGVRIL
jgi:hypothetical protein